MSEQNTAHTTTGASQTLPLIVIDGAVVFPYTVASLPLDEQTAPAADAALKDSRKWLGHVHGADSNRCQPGAGQTDFVAIKSALREIGFTGFVALECRLTGDPTEALTQAARVLS